MLSEPRLRFQITAIWILAAIAELARVARLIALLRTARSGIAASAIGFAIFEGLIAAIGVVAAAVFITRLVRREYRGRSPNA